MYRFREDTLVDEFIANIAPTQSGAKQPHRSRPEPSEKPVESPEKEIFDENIPDYAQSRARAEYEKANLLELDRKRKESELLLRSDVEKAWSDAITASKTKLLALPTMAKQRIPHLDLEEIEILTELVREALEALANDAQE